jgi:hypothetical protein
MTPNPIDSEISGPFSGSPLRIVLVLGGCVLGVGTILFAAAVQAGATPSAASGGSQPSVTSLAQLLAAVVLTGVASLLIAQGLISRRKPVPAERPRSPLRRIEMKRTFLVAGVAMGIFGGELVCMGLAIMDDAFCFSHGYGPCSLSDALRVVPNGVVIAGAVLAFVGACSTALLVRSSKSG